MTTQQALVISASQKPDLILMDIRMPMMSGDEAARRIHEISGLEKTPVIAVTASVIRSKHFEQVLEPFQKVLYKPVNVNDLAYAMSEFLDFTLVEDREEEDVESGIEEVTLDDVGDLSHEFILELQQTLQKKVLPAYRRCENSHYISDMQKFEKLMSGDPFIIKIPALRRFGENFSESLELLDFEKMNSLLAGFEALVDSVMMLIEKGLENV